MTGEHGVPLTVLLASVPGVVQRTVVLDGQQGSGVGQVDPSQHESVLVKHLVLHLGRE